MDGNIDVNGNLDEVLHWIMANQKSIVPSSKVSVARQLVNAISRRSEGSRKKDIAFHYDLGNDFFSLWLDETMSYSCAYFNSREDTLKQAQLQKIDHVLKKLQLKPGETILDIGSGWGWLIIRAAQKYGVKASGITLSEDQYAKTKGRIAELGLEESVAVQLMDYRQLADSGKTFDKIASIGMLEHVGKGNLGLFMSAVQKLLDPGGLALIHSITNLTEGETNAWIQKNIFPGGYIPSLRELVWMFPEYQLHVLDIESLRMHYAMTLDRWSEEYENNFERVKNERGERFARMWRLYLKSCSASFKTTGMDIHQILVSHQLNNDLPLTRQHLYQESNP
jgi:cyclopropane-fatty-acyl-phospholipid synthase